MGTALSPLQLQTALKQQPPAPVYLVAGEEDLLRDEAVATLKAALLGEGGDFNFDVFYGDEAAGNDILTCALEVPVFADRRVVLVKNAEKISAREADVLLPYLAAPVQATTVIFVSTKLDGRLKFSQALGRAAVTIDCSPLRDVQLGPWVSRDAQRLGLKLDEKAVGVLKETSGGSLYAVRRELEKLASYITTDRPATDADVYQLRGVEPGASVFDLTLAIAAAQRGRVLSILARNLEAGEAPLRILGSLAWQYRRIWKMKELLREGGREGEAARTLRMDPAQVRTFLGRLSDGHVREALRLFWDADGQLKGGSSGRPKMIMERVLLQLCQSVQQAQSDAPRRTPTPTGRGAARAVSNVRTITSGNRTGR